MEMAVSECWAVWRWLEVVVVGREGFGVAYFFCGAGGDLTLFDSHAYSHVRYRRLIIANSAMDVPIPLSGPLRSSHNSAPHSIPCP